LPTHVWSPVCRLGTHFKEVYEEWGYSKSSRHMQGSTPYVKPSQQKERRF